MVFFRTQTHRKSHITDPDTLSATIEIQEPVYHKTPLPRTQLANAFLIYICGSLAQLSILPFINQVKIPHVPLFLPYLNPVISSLVRWRLSAETSAKLDFTSDSWYASIDSITLLIRQELIQGSLYNISSAITCLHWNRLSDRIGRKPVLMIAMAGMATCVPLLGASRTFLGLVARFVTSAVCILFACGNGDIRHQPLSLRSYGWQFGWVPIV